MVVSSQPTNMNHESKYLQVIARAPFKIYYEGPAESVSGANRVGVFDILPGHADFFSLLQPGEIVIKIPDDDELISFEITNGIITVRDDTAMVFVNM